MRILPACMLIAFLPAKQVVADDSGWFTTMQLGIADYDTTQKSSTRSFGDTDDASFSWALGLGYDFNRHFAVRGVFEHSTDHSTVNRCPPDLFCAAVVIRENTDFNNWSMVAMPSLPLDSGVNLYGTIGLQYRDADGGPELPDDGGFELLFGGGLEYSLTSRLSIGGEAQVSGADYLAGRFVINYAF